MPARTRNLNVVVGADTKPFQRGIKDADRSLDKFSRNATARSKATAAGIRGLGLAATGATVGVVGLVGVGKQLVDAYSESEKSQAKLQAQLKATGVSYAAHRKEIDKAVTATSRLAAVDDEDLQDAFTSLVRSSGKVGQSMKDLTLVTDLSRAKNLDLTKSADLIGKVHAGNIGVLKRYGIAIDPVTTAQDRLKASTSKATDEQKRAAKAADTAATSTKAIGELQKRFAGQAEAYGKTNAGAVDRFKVAFQNLEETAGKALAPTLTNLATKASKFVEQMQDGTGQGGRFVDKLKEIRDQIEPVAKWLFNAGKNVARFAQDHPNVTKLAVAVAAVGSAIKLIRFAGAISGFSAFLSAGKAAASGLKRILAGAGTAAGEAAAENLADGFAKGNASQKGSYTRAGRSASQWMGIGLKAGAVGIGIAAAAVTVKAFLDNYDKSIAAWRQHGIGTDPSNAPLTGRFPGVAQRGRRASGGNQIGSRPHGAGGGRVFGPVKGADSVPAVLSPDEFVVTGGGERMLESMTFPGVLNWLEGAQPSHFKDGGRAPKRMATGGRPSGQVYAGYQAGLEGQHVSGLLGSVLEYVGEPHKKRDRALSSLGSAGAAPADAPSAVSAMLGRAARYAGGPYDYGGGHGGFGVRGGRGGFDCSGYVSAILGPGVLSSPMAVVQPMASALLGGDGQYVTVGMRGSSGMNAHTMIKIGNQYFESGGGHGASRVGGWNGSFQHYHPRGLRGGGRVGFAKGGRVPALLRTIAGGSQKQVRAALSAVGPLLQNRGSFGSLRSYINTANTLGHRKGVKAVNQRGLRSFIALAQASYGELVGRGQAGIDAGEAGFDQASTDLGNQLITAGASDADVAGRQGALATSQLNQLYKDRTGLMQLRARAVRSGSKKTVRDIDARLATNQSDIYAKQAAVVGFGNDLRTAQTAATDTSAQDALQQAIEDNTAAQKAHTDALVAVQTAIDNQTKTAAALNTTTGNQALRYLADYMSNQIGAGVTQRARTAGTGAIAVNY